MTITLVKLDKNHPTEPDRTVSRVSGKKVVVVDDSPRQRAALRSLYESLGLVCVGEAANGLECLSVVKRTAPDVVSLDALMPVMHGVEALGYLREEGFSGLLVFVTELSRSEALAEVRSLGHQPDAVFSKSDSREAFQNALNELFLAEEFKKVERVDAGREEKVS
jgi:CheY-like chemotaxis protein